jgi:hypothetical protein
MGDFTMFKCRRFKNLLIEVMFERHLEPLEITFNLKFDVAITKEGMLCPETNFIKHLQRKLGLFYVENELQKVKWPEGWYFAPYNTRYTYEHSWRAVHQRKKASHLGIDIALSAPENLRNDRKQLKEESFRVGEQISKMLCFQPSEYLELVSRRKT